MHPFSEQLLLSSRRTLPAEIAYLRDKYPEPQWRTHHNFGELAASWLQVHDGFRAQGAALQRDTQDFREGRRDAPPFAEYFMPRLGRYLQYLEAHHHREDAQYFPRFRSLDPRMVRGFNLLEHDHTFIHDTLLDVVDKARVFMQEVARGKDAAHPSADSFTDTAVRLSALVEQHLGDEEELVIPAMLEHSERSLC